MDPTFKAEGDIFVYRGEARIEYLREEPLHGKSCPLYRISGPGIGGTTGSIWADPKSGWLEKVEIPFPDNPEWSSFRLELQGTETMTPEAWKKFIADSLAGQRRTRRARARRDSAAARHELLLLPDRLGADRGELGVLPDRVEQRVVVHGRRRTR